MKGRLRPSHLLILCLVFMLAVGMPLMADEVEEKTEEWVAWYNGPGDGPDFAKAIAVDSLGNVLVTGRCQGLGIDSDYATVKYDPNGNEIWVSQYDGPGNGVDFAKAIALDLLGNVYVTGESYGSGTSSDYATVKYDPNGNEIWAARYDGPWNDWDSANAIVIDSSGNLYVTGWSENDYATVKYDPNGNEIWAARYDGPWSGGDIANAITIDSSSNVYVTGTSEGDYATIKYDPNGTELWVKRYNGPGNSSDEPTGIAIDLLGNIYVTGKSTASGTNRDYATIKYDTNGTELWVKRYNGPGNSIDEAAAIAIDSSGNVYVTGESIGTATNRDYATIKYDTNGTELWVKRYNGPGNSVDKAAAIAIDSSGNVYVTGESIGTATNRDYATIKYDTNGTELWLGRYNGPENDSDEATAIAIDSMGNVYVTGESISSEANRDYATLKYRGAEEIEVIMELPAEWSMISLPVIPDKATLNDLFPEALVVYKYQKTMGYVRVKESENFEFGIGYWILLNIPQSYNIKGIPITEYALPVDNGWYMIGGCTSSAHRMVKNGDYDVIYSFTQTGYIRIPETELLEPGEGYWILFSNTSEGAEFTASTLVLKRR